MTHPVHPSPASGPFARRLRRTARFAETSVILVVGLFVVVVLGDMAVSTVAPRTASEPASTAYRTVDRMVVHAPGDPVLLRRG